MKIANGEYAIYGIGEDGRKAKMGGFKVANMKVTTSTSDIVPSGEISSQTAEKIQRFIDDGHGYIHIEKV